MAGLRRRWRGAVELDVTVDGRTVPALAYPALVGEPAPGDRVLLNVGALELGLGTGGYALVVALPDRLPADPPGPASRAEGHAVKARYTPLQAIVLSVDEPAWTGIREVIGELRGLHDVLASPAWRGLNQV